MYEDFLKKTEEVLKSKFPEAEVFTPENLEVKIYSNSEGCVEFVYDNKMHKIMFTIDNENVEMDSEIVTVEPDIKEEVKVETEKVETVEKESIHEIEKSQAEIFEKMLSSKFEELKSYVDTRCNELKSMYDEFSKKTTDEKEIELETQKAADSEKEDDSDQKEEEDLKEDVLDTKSKKSFLKYDPEIYGYAAATRLNEWTA